MVLSGRVWGGGGRRAEGLEEVRLVVEYGLEKGRGGDTWAKVGEITTGAKGVFSGFLDEENLPAGRLVFRLRLSPDVGPSVWSPVVVVEIQPGGIGASAVWILGVLLGVSVVGAAIFYGVRRFAAWVRETRKARNTWRPGRNQGREVVKAVPLGDPPDEVADQPNALGGRIFDDLDSDSLAGVGLALRRARGDAAAVAETTTDKQGCFSIQNIQSGRYILEITSHGYITAGVELSIPHDGSLRYFRVNLTPVRQRVRERYTWLLDQYSPRRTLWGDQTPYEIQNDMLLILNQIKEPVSGITWPKALLETLREQLEQPHAEWPGLLQALTALLEEVYFSPRLYPESLLVQVDLLCERLQQPFAALGKQRRGTTVAGVGKSRSERSVAQEAGRG